MLGGKSDKAKDVTFLMGLLFLLFHGGGMFVRGTAVILSSGTDGGGIIICFGRFSLEDPRSLPPDTKIEYRK